MIQEMEKRLKWSKMLAATRIRWGWNFFLASKIIQNSAQVLIVIQLLLYSRLSIVSHSNDDVMNK